MVSWVFLQQSFSGFDFLVLIFLAVGGVDSIGVSPSFSEPDVTGADLLARDVLEGIFSGEKGSALLVAPPLARAGVQILLDVIVPTLGVLSVGLTVALWGAVSIGGA